MNAINKDVDETLTLVEFELLVVEYLFPVFANSNSIREEIIWGHLWIFTVALHFKPLMHELLCIHSMQTVF